MAVVPGMISAIVRSGPRKGVTLPVIAGEVAMRTGRPLTQALRVEVTSAVHALIAEGSLWWRASAARPGGDSYGLIQGPREGH